MRLKWVWLVVLLGGVMLAGCKRKATKVPTIDRPPPITIPTTQEMSDQRLREQLAELDPIPDLGEGISKVVPDGTPEGEVWTAYPNGLMIHELLPKDGLSPKLGQSVSIVYKGFFPAPSRSKEVEFDKNDADHPLIFTVGSRSVVRGLSIGVSKMKVGSRCRIYIPADLAYGEKGMPQASIPPNQALIFEVELVSVTGEAIDTKDLPLPKVEPLGPPMPSGLPSTRP